MEEIHPEDESQLPSTQGNLESLDEINPETEEMEIHHHPHVHHSKKWKDYLYEFLMLFLAVMSGFFMENQREHYVEKQRAKELVVSLISDLKKDTIEVNRSNQRLREVIATADSLMAELDKPRGVQNDTLLQLRGTEIGAFNFFDPQMGTYEQIKTSGSLRYFSHDLVEKMNSYEVDTNYLMKMSKMQIDFLVMQLGPFMATLRNARFQKAYLNKTAYHKSIFASEPSTEKLDAWYNMAYAVNKRYNMIIDRNEQHKKNAAALIAALQQQYGISG